MRRAVSSSPARALPAGRLGRVEAAVAGSGGRVLQREEDRLGTLQPLGERDVVVLVRQALESGLRVATGCQVHGAEPDGRTDVAEIGRPLRRIGQVARVLPHGPHAEPRLVDLE